MGGAAKGLLTGRYVDRTPADLGNTATHTADPPISRYCCCHLLDASIPGGITPQRN